MTEKRTIKEIVTDIKNQIEYSRHYHEGYDKGWEDAIAFVSDYLDELENRSND